MSCRTREVQVGKHQKIELTPTQCAALDLVEILGGDIDSGCGEHACAYTTSKPDTLIKITDDAEDVFAFRAAKGTGLVPKAGTPVQLGDRPFFAFEVAKAKLPDVRDQIILNDLVNHQLVEVMFGSQRPKEERNPIPLGRGKFRFEAPESIPDVIEAECKVFGERVGKLNRADLGTGPEFRERCRVIGNTAADVIEKLAKVGVKFTDAHAGNWGFYKGRLVAIDLGLSHPPMGRPVARLNGTESLRWPRWR
jgi:hypothetical protein